MDMTRRAFLVACGISIAASQSRTRPSILFILSEDHHFQAAGFAGNPKILTPNLDALASRGMVFSNAISSSPQCAPSRGVLLTGLEPFRTGVLSNYSKRFTTAAGPSVIAQLQSSGYETSLIGKWQTPNTPAELGFSSAPLWIKTNDQSEPPYLMSKGIGGKETLKAEDANEAFTQAAVEYLGGAKQKPFFLFLSLLNSRARSPEEKYLGRYRGQPSATLAPPNQDPEGKNFAWKRYYATISQMDDCVGRVVAALEKSGELANTILFFAGDNGYLCGSHGKIGKVYPWEAALRVPMFVAGHGVKGGQTIDAPVSTADLPATWLDLAEAKLPANALCGRSLKSTIETGKPVTNESFALWCEPSKEHGRGLEPYRIIRTRTHKLVQWQSGVVELYEWPNDPHEARNLAADPSSQKVLGQLKRKLEAQMADRKDPFLAPGAGGA